MYGNVNSLSRSLKNHQEFKPNVLPHFISVHVRSCPYSDNAGSESPIFQVVVHLWMVYIPGKDGDFPFDTFNYQRVHPHSD